MGSSDSSILVALQSNGKSKKEQTENAMTWRDKRKKERIKEERTKERGMEKSREEGKPTMKSYQQGF